jgi:uncharacterized coiled-coil DUF342 family protein
MRAGPPTRAVPRGTELPGKQVLLARIDKLRRANSTLRRKYREARLAADESADRLEALQLEVERLQRELQRFRRRSNSGKERATTPSRGTSVRSQ